MKVLSPESFPIEGFFLPNVNISDSEEPDEQQHLAEEKHALIPAADIAIDDGPRIEKGCLDIEQNEQHRDLIEADVDALAVDVENRHAAVVRGELGRISLMTSDNPVQSQDGRADTGGDDEHDQHRQKAVRHAAVSFKYASALSRVSKILNTVSSFVILSSARMRCDGFTSAIFRWRSSNFCR